MVAYKIVRNVRGRLYSCAVEGRARLRYDPGRMVRAPRGTALFAFQGEKTARDGAENLHLDTGHKYEVWSCSGEQSHLSLERVADIYEPWHNMLKVWRGGKLNWWRMYKVPRGTVFMDSLKLENRLAVFP